MLAILISAMGLLALAAFTAEQRTEEIGIRKVLGASITGVVTLLSKDFMKMVLLAMLIAFLIARYFMDRRPGTFASYIHIPSWMFAVTGLSACIFTLLSDHFQSVKE